MNKKLKIWLTIDSSKTGGIETHVLQLAKGLIKANINVKVIFIKNHGAHPLIPILKKEGIKCLVLGGKVISLLKLIQFDSPDLIHSHGYKAGITLRLACLMLQKPHFNTYHAGEKSTGKLAFYDAFDRYTAFLNSQSFTVSDLIQKRIPSKSIVVDNFISMPNKITKTDKQIACVGRLSYEKGIDRLLPFAREHPHIDIHFYGTGPMHDDLKITAPSNCIFHGDQASMDNIWPKIDLVLMPSRFEGLPLTAIEAMARGIPVIAFNVGGLKKLIQNGQNGWLIENQNCLNFYQHILNWQQLDKVTKDNIRQKAINKVLNHFSDRAIIPTIHQYYLKALTHFSQPQSLS